MVYSDLHKLLNALDMGLHHYPAEFSEYSDRMWQLEQLFLSIHGGS